MHIDRPFEKDPTYENWNERMDVWERKPESLLEAGYMEAQFVVQAQAGIQAVRAVFQPYVQHPFHHIDQVEALHNRSESTWRKKLGQASFAFAEVATLIPESGGLKKYWLGIAAVELMPGGRSSLRSGDGHVRHLAPRFSRTYLPLLNEARAALGYEELED